MMNTTKKHHKASKKDGCLIDIILWVMLIVLIAVLLSQYTNLFERQSIIHPKSKDFYSTREAYVSTVATSNATVTALRNSLSDVIDKVVPDGNHVVDWFSMSRQLPVGLFAPRVFEIWVLCEDPHGNENVIVVINETKDDADIIYEAIHYGMRYMPIYEVSSVNSAHTEDWYASRYFDSHGNYADYYIRSPMDAKIRDVLDYPYVP